MTIIYYLTIVFLLLHYITAESKIQFRALPLHHGDEKLYFDDWFRATQYFEHITMIRLTLPQDSKTIPTITQCRLKIGIFDMIRESQLPIVVNENFIDEIIVADFHGSESIFLLDKSIPRTSPNLIFHLRYECDILMESWNDQITSSVGGGNLSVTSTTTTGSSTFKRSIVTNYLKRSNIIIPPKAVAMPTWDYKNNYNKKLQFYTQFTATLPTPMPKILIFELTSSSLWIPQVLPEQQQIKGKEYYFLINGVNIPSERIISDINPRITTHISISIQPSELELDIILSHANNLNNNHDVLFTIESNIIVFVSPDQQWANIALKSPLQFEFSLLTSPNSLPIVNVPFWSVKPIIYSHLPYITIPNQLLVDDNDIIHTSTTFDFDQDQIHKDDYDNFNFKGSDLVIQHSVFNCKDVDNELTDINGDDNNIINSSEPIPLVTHDIYRNNLSNELLRQVNLTHIRPDPSQYSYKYVPISQDGIIPGHIDSFFNLTNVLFYNNTNNINNFNHDHKIDHSITSLQTTTTSPSLTSPSPPPPSKFQLQTNINCPHQSSSSSPSTQILTQISFNTKTLVPSTQEDMSETIRVTLSSLISPSILNRAMKHAQTLTQYHSESLSILFDGLHWPISEHHNVDIDQLHVKMNFLYNNIALYGDFKTCYIANNATTTNDIIDKNIPIYHLPTNINDDSNFDGIDGAQQITKKIPSTQPIQRFKFILDRIKNKDNSFYTRLDPFTFTCPDVYILSYTLAKTDNNNNNNNNNILVNDWIVITTLLQQHSLDLKQDNNDYNYDDGNINNNTNEIDMSNNPSLNNFIDLTRRNIVPIVINNDTNNAKGGYHWFVYFIIACVSIIVLAVLIGGGLHLIKRFNTIHKNRKGNHEDNLDQNNSLLSDVNFDDFIS